MEKQVNGVITSVYLGEAKDNPYGKRSAGCSITIDGTRYSCFVSEYNGSVRMQTKVNDVYTEIKEGMHVAFKATQKDGSQYWNFKPMDVLILASGSASQSPQSTNTPQPTHSATNTANVAKNGDMDGFCEGLAKLIAAYKFQGKQMPPQDQIDRVANYIKKIFG